MAHWERDLSKGSIDWTVYFSRFDSPQILETEMKCMLIDSGGGCNLAVPITINYLGVKE